MKYFLVFLFFLPTQLYADVVVQQNIDVDTTWSSEYGTYIVDTLLTIASGTELTILPGTVVKFRGYQSGIFVDGSLVANSTGTSSSIVFTSYPDDVYNGDSNQDATSTSPNARSWFGIIFNPGSIGQFDNVIVKYSGLPISGINLSPGLSVRSANVVIKNSLLSNNGNFGISNIEGYLNVENSIIENSILGIYTESGVSNFTKNIIRNNSLEGIHATIYGEFNLIDNQFISNQSTGVVGAGVKFVHERNTSSDLSSKGFNTLGVPRDGQTIGGSDLPLIISGGYMLIASGTTANILPGTTIKIDYNGSIDILGNLNINGEKNSKVVITSIKDDSVSGDTNGDGYTTSPTSNDLQGLIFSNGSSANISNTIFKYGSRGIINNGGDISIDNSIFDPSTQVGIHSYDGNLNVTNSQFLSQNGIINYGQNVSSATNNWWGSNTGPYDTSSSTPTGIGASVSLNVGYFPWLRRDPTLPNPVIIIPGIMGSYLLKDDGSDDEVWMNLTKMTFSIQDDYLDYLQMDGTGKSNYEIKSENLISRISNFDFFEGLETSISDNNIQVFGYSYDWRMSVEKNSLELSNYIDSLLLQTGAIKVDIVAHSMGGLILKNYIRNDGAAKIGRFIDIGTPHLGSPKAFKILNFGDNFGFEKFGLNVLNPIKIKFISQNMPSVYQLLPSEKYFDSTNSDYSYYLFNGIDTNERLTFVETKQYLKNQGRNSSLIDLADNLHKEIDDLEPKDYGVDTYNIVGCGTPTFGKIYVLSKDADGYDYAISMINGDGTVPLRSAESMRADRTYYVNEAEHATMPSSIGVKELIVSILKEDKNFDRAYYSNILDTSESCSIPDGKLISFHSPITLQIKDQYDNYAGPNENGDIENNIKGLVYEVIDDVKFAYLPTGNNYTVYGQATGVGDFYIRIENIENEKVVKTYLFNDILLIENTKTQFIVDNEDVGIVYIDSDGDGAVDLEKTVSTSTTGFLEPSGKIEPTISTEKLSYNTPQSRLENNVALKNEIVSSINTKLATESPTLSSSSDKQAKKLGTSMVKIYKGNNYASVGESATFSIIGILKALWLWFINKL